MTKDITEKMNKERKSLAAMLSKAAANASESQERPFRSGMNNQEAVGAASTRYTLKRSVITAGQSLGTLATGFQSESLAQGLQSGAAEGLSTARAGKSKGRTKTIRLSKQQTDALKSKRTMVSQPSLQSQINAGYSTQKFLTKD